MDAEIIPFPSKGESILNTLESTQECFDLAEAIDDQVSFWRSQAHAPSMRHRSLAASIVEDCTPPEDTPQNPIATVNFGSKLTLEDAAQKNAHEERRALLVSWVQNDVVDAVKSQNEAYNDYFERVAYIGENPSVPEQFRIATQAVRRLFIVREQLTKRIGRTDQQDSDAFREVMNRLLNEIF